MGLVRSDSNIEIGCMLGTIIYYLLWESEGINLSRLEKINGSGSLNLLFCSEKSNKGVQSAGNVRIPEGEGWILRDYTPIIYEGGSKLEGRFDGWLAGVLDGDGNYDIRKIGGKEVLKAIRIKLHNRDVRILARIKNELKRGRIREEGKKPYSTYVISKRGEMEEVVRRVNGKIRIKVGGFKKSCENLGIDYKEADYKIKEKDAYLSGLIDTDGSIILNYNCNRIECNIELKYNEYTSRLNLDEVIPNTKPSVYLREKKNQTPGKRYKSIAFKYQTVGGMIPLYEYILENRLYSDMKYYRVMKIKKFMEIRGYAEGGGVEREVYKKFVLDYVKYKNPKWMRVGYVNLLKEQ